MKEIFRAIHCNEIDILLKKMGLIDNYLRKEILCSNCGDVINKDNFGGVTKNSGIILFCCNKEDCYNNFLTNSFGGD